MTIDGLWEQVRAVSLGRDVKLSTLNAECFQEKGRPLRIAVDTPLALFEYKSVTLTANQDNWGGMNHITRIFYHHVQHLLTSGVQPIFVFDGPSKPPEKGSTHPPSVRPCRHVPRMLERIARGESRTEEDKKCERELSHVIPFCRALLDHIGLPYRDAPGEAEAECAALEQAGIVDAVLTRDGDAFVFGSRRILQKLHAEKKVAMVREFYMENMAPDLRHDHIFLIAMMAGGDYDSGIHGCGANIAVEVARQHHFGSQLIALLQHFDGPALAARLASWKARLVDALRNNPGDKLSCRRPGIANLIESNSNFPSTRIAKYYLQPVVSENIASLRVNWTRQIPIERLRNYTREVFNWQHRHYAGKFVRLFYLPCLTRKLLLHGAAETDGSDLIEGITLSKKDNDALGLTRLLRVEFSPREVVGIDIYEEDIVRGFQGNLRERVWDPRPLVREWVPEWVVKDGAPSVYESWRESEELKEEKKGKRGTKRTRDQERSSSVEAPQPKRGRGRPRNQAARESMAGPSTRPDLRQQSEVIDLTEEPGQESGVIDLTDDWEAGIIDLTEDD